MRLHALKFVQNDGDKQWYPMAYTSRLGNRNWVGLAYGDNKFVALSSGGYISTATSAEASAWNPGWSQATQNANLGDREWRAITYGPAKMDMGVVNKFIALSNDGYVATSSDGINWSDVHQDTNLSTETNWKALTNGNSKFMAVAHSGGKSLSSNGSTWGDIAYIRNHGWRSAAYGNGKFVVLGYYGYIRTSTDGVTWDTARLIDNLGSHDWQEICFNGTKFLALGSQGYVSESFDGVNWDAAVLVDNLDFSQEENLYSETNNWTGLAQDGINYIAISDSGYTAFRRV